MRPTAFSPENAETKRRRSDWQVIQTLLPFLWPARDVSESGEIRLRVIVAIVCIGLAKWATVITPLYLQLAVDALAPQDAAMIPLFAVLAYGLARFLGLAFAQVRDAVFAKVGVRAVRRSAGAILTHLHTLSLKFHLDRRTGALSRTIERGVVAIESLVSISLFNVVPTILEVILVGVILWNVFSGVFAAITVATVIIYVAFTIITTEWRMRFRRESNALDNKANTRAIDSLLNYETVKTFGNESMETTAYDNVMSQYEKAAVRNQSSLALLNVGQSLIISVGVVVLMVYAAMENIAGRMTVGEFTAVNVFMLQLAQPLNFFGFVYRNIKQSLVDLEKMFELLDVPAEVIDNPDAKPLNVTGGEVRFEGVSFAYDERRPILKNVSFTLAPGQMVALVGATGSGKSTIGRLLFRYYDVSEGRILIDGQDIRDVQQHSVRKAIGIVPQDTVLFNDTIGYNLTYAKLESSQQDIEKAAELAHIDAFIKTLPDGYQTTVGERGLKLSGGEKQRVAIARVILKGSPILLFDEATSALDTHTEKEIQANLREVATGRSTLVIAHRLSTIVDADQILVLDKGGIVERGTYNELMAKGGLFAAAWNKQQRSLAVADEIVKDIFAAASE
ncbi:MAG: ABC transporter ATP-binding protein/permease [Alphaproteobacteria bacterium]|nr:ABC transporter ATP-binding protein/permease [Alphaproteobacteria bacterium]PHX99454.1 MAG: metal ABC transporter permease [Rhodospirillaceae bacterium]